MFKVRFAVLQNFKPELIVLHIMDGTLSGTDSWFADPSSQVSSHYGIGLNELRRVLHHCIGKERHRGFVLSYRDI